MFSFVAMLAEQRGWANDLIRQVVDDDGSTVTVASVPRRIISLSPGATESLYALGCGGRIIATCRYCNFPAAATNCMHVGDFSNPNLEAIVGHHPDLVIATGGPQRELIPVLRRIGVPVVVLFPRGLAGVYRDFAIIGTLLGCEQAARTQIESMRARTVFLSAPYVHLPSDQRPRVYVELWGDPIMAIGGHSYTGELINLAGGENIADGTSQDYPKLSTEYVIRANPDVIILTHGEDGKVASERVAKRPGWNKISAVRKGRVTSGFNPDLILRPGPRLVDGLVELVRLLHPGTLPQ